SLLLSDNYGPPRWSVKTAGRDIPELQAFSFYIGRNGLLADQGGGELAQSRGALNAITALADEPEEAFLLAIESAYRIVVRGKRSQAAPAPGEAGDLDIDRLLKAGNALG